jgi:hypothetical protein
VVVRAQRDGHLCIPQAEHAAVSGLLAAAWAEPGLPEGFPREQLLLAAAHHDDGMVEFDRDPELDPESGLPRNFLRMPLGTWLSCWRRGPGLVASRSPLAGVLVSLHGDHLLGYRRPADAGERAEIDAYRTEQAELRARWLAAAGAGELPAATIEAARELIEVWDAMSLALCMPRLPDSFGEVPVAGRPRAIAMAVAGEGRVAVDPWPFAVAELSLRARGRLLSAPVPDRPRLRAALAAARVRELEWLLRPSRR